MEDVIMTFAFALLALVGLIIRVITRVKINRFIFVT